ncbi:MAG: TlpA family protein disulfide reductase [Candidatus Margulisbacteria bacterium]|nr:TlpA family protein disulfide reductase [Candidatus Margulisiibacteriota bacterium]
MKKLIFLLVFAVFFCCAVSANDGPAAGDISPDLTLKDLSGKPFILSDNFNKDTVILVFFASWSKSCQNELEYLSTIENARVVAVAFDRNVDNLKEFIKEKEIKFTVLTDKKLISMNDFRLLIIPTTFVIDKNGKIKNIYVEFDDNVQKAIEADLLVP